MSSVYLVGTELTFLRSFLRAPSSSLALNLAHRRLKDFVGALRDYDECSFRHYRGVHVGRRALDQAANQLRSIQDGQAGSPVGDQGGGGGAEGGVGSSKHRVSIPSAADTRAAGAVAAGENPGRVEQQRDGLAETTDNENNNADGDVVAANYHARDVGLVADKDDKMALGEGAGGAADRPVSSAGGGRIAGLGDGGVTEGGTATERAATEGAPLAGLVLGKRYPPGGVPHLHWMF